MKQSLFVESMKIRGFNSIGLPRDVPITYLVQQLSSVKNVVPILYQQKKQSQLLVVTA